MFQVLFYMTRRQPSCSLFPYTTLFRSGARSWMLFAGASLGGGTLVEYCIDVSDRKRVEADLRENQERLRLILDGARDRKSTRLNSSHLVISYAVFCLKKKNTKHIIFLK